jgi:hypothetical protein
MDYNEILKESELIDIGFALGTTDEYSIKEYAEEDGIDLDWDEINEGIERWESNYKDILSDFVTSASEQGHDSDNDLVGSASATKEQLLDILERADDVDETNRRAYFMEGTGSMNEYDNNLPSPIGSSLEFFDIPQEIFDEFYGRINEAKKIVIKAGYKVLK